mgnify:CR=1 FL=1
MAELVQGRIWVLGDDISTDHILPSRYMAEIRPEELRRHVLEGVARDFPRKIEAGDILVAGRNMGYGSSREQAILALKAAGIKAIVARSYSRIFFRNCINNGFLAVACPGLPKGLKDREVMTIDPGGGRIQVAGEEFSCEPFPEVLLAVLKHGGLIEYLAVNPQEYRR